MAGVMGDIKANSPQNIAQRQAMIASRAAKFAKKTGRTIVKTFTNPGKLAKTVAFGPAGMFGNPFGGGIDYKKSTVFVPGKGNQTFTARGNSNKQNPMPGFNRPANWKPGQKVPAGWKPYKARYPQPGAMSNAERAKTATKI